MFVTNNATVAAIMGLLGGIATSGFWDASGYPAVQEAYPAAPGSALIMIKFFVALSSIFYPLICVQTAAAGNWEDQHCNSFSIILCCISICMYQQDSFMM